jgi:predicted CxxxxCH...CXXCH cytochrome family protein
MDALAQIKYGMNAVALLNDMAASAKQTDLCGYCHDTPGADADHAEPGPAETAFYPVWDKSAASSGSYTSGDGNCTNLCHNNRATGVGTYGWLDSGTSQCIMCHNNINVTTAGTTGATHDRHLNLASDFGPTLGCDDCHDATTDWSSNSTPDNGLHINGVLNIAGDKIADDEYTGTSIPGANFGSCSGGVNPNVCHNDGSMSAPPARTYVWGSALSNDCASCHLAVPSSNAHPTHVASADSSYGGGTPWPAGNNSTAGNYDFSCVNCHGTTRANHLNGATTITGVGYNDGTVDGIANGTCAAAVCHSDGTTPVNYTETPAWNASFTAGACDGCHGNIPTTAGHPQHVLEVGFHYNAIYSGLEDFLPVVDSDAATVDQGLDDGDGNPEVITLSNPAGYDQLRGHGGNLVSDGTPTSTVVSCNVCHFETITVNTNDLATYADADPDTRACAECHDDSVTPRLGIARIADQRKHVNGAVNVRFFDEKVRSKAQVRNENAYTVDSDGEAGWTKTSELTNNWVRFNGFKALDGSSYDEQPDTLHNMATAYYAAENPGDPTPEENYYSTAEKTCMISCHLWEAGRVDKAPVHWVDNATDGSAPLMCIDCHSRLPK